MNYGVEITKVIDATADYAVGSAIGSVQEAVALQATGLLIKLLVLVGGIIGVKIIPSGKGKAIAGIVSGIFAILSIVSLLDLFGKIF